tara:strand:- start:123 stop:389 length:267 start_codon:yes stop_codon:yes gene_type:complete
MGSKPQDMPFSNMVSKTGVPGEKLREYTPSYANILQAMRIYSRYLDIPKLDLPKNEAIFELIRLLGALVSIFIQIGPETAKLVFFSYL